MKKSGRTLKQRLYGIKLVAEQLHRARYFRGHGVHSPYVYSIVRKVFMQRKLFALGTDLYDALMERGVARHRAVQLQNLVAHCGYTSWRVDRMEHCDMLLCTLDVAPAELRDYAAFARREGLTLCILSPYKERVRKAACRAIVDEHPSTTVDNRAYLLVFNNHLPKQKFIL